MGLGVFIHRSDSIYDDSPAERYQFPSQYLGRVKACVGDWVIYYEPKKVVGTRGYFAVAKIQQVIPDPKVPGMHLALIEPGGVGAVTVFFKRRPRGLKRLDRPVEIARGQRNFGLGNDAARAGDRFARTEGAGRASQQSLGAVEVAELCHRDAAQRQRRRIVAHSDEVQGMERIAHGEARPAALISESIEISSHEIPTHLSLPAHRSAAVNLSHHQRPASAGRRKERKDDDTDGTYDRDT